ncbi:hypothetical protein AVEN_193486-1 [Araneus ventricosus]|uniref:Uncharacterized protein n=1 Tax=Araneus ventricosus TaxID=182803 RepID=A0A4Y2UCV9_ARAVE|nr:hypothetical protein AVEN_193486-1 [Araneus ventricosus]
MENLRFSLKGKEKTPNSITKVPNQIVQPAETPKNTDTSLPPSQETVNFSLPEDLLANKDELADLFRLLKQMQIILAKVPDVKKDTRRNGKS